MAAKKTAKTSGKKLQIVPWGTLMKVAGVTPVIGQAPSKADIRKIVAFVEAKFETYVPGKRGRGAGTNLDELREVAEGVRKLFDDYEADELPMQVVAVQILRSKNEGISKDEIKRAVAKIKRAGKRLTEKREKPGFIVERLQVQRA